MRSMTFNSVSVLLTAMAALGLVKKKMLRSSGVDRTRAKIHVVLCKEGAHTCILMKYVERLLGCGVHME